MNGILTSAEIKKEYPDIFKGLGYLEGTCKIHLRENYVPSVYPARKVPQSQKQKLKKELDRLVQTGVLVKAERPTDWVLPLVIVEKPNGDLRLCLDPMDLNEYIRREHCHLPHRSEILSEMADARYFTQMDASQGFYQIQLDEESTQLCTVATPFGRYSFKRLPYGINCAPEIFHAKIQQLFECETGVKVFMDDIVVWGRTREEHDARLKRALATVRRSGLKLNEKKCVFGVTEFTYLGENTPGSQARSGQSCWNMQHASTHNQRGSTESTWHGKLHGHVCAELDGKDNSPETTATREERLAVGSRTGKGIAKHKRLLHHGTTPEVL